MAYNNSYNGNSRIGGNGCGCTDERKALLDQIRAYDFAMIETSLYLDAYECKDALAYFNKVSQKAKELKKKYESQYGPLTLSGVNCENGWTWVDAPWPWELEAN